MQSRLCSSAGRCVCPPTCAPRCAGCTPTGQNVILSRRCGPSLPPPRSPCRSSPWRREPLRCGTQHQVNLERLNGKVDKLTPVVFDIACLANAYIEDARSWSNQVEGVEKRALMVAVRSAGRHVPTRSLECGCSMPPCLSGSLTPARALATDAGAYGPLPHRARTPPIRHLPPVGAPVPARVAASKTALEPDKGGVLGGRGGPSPARGRWCLIGHHYLVA